MAEAERGQWAQKLQFIFSAIGLVFGLGHLWRIPSLAYENGGSAFIFVYVLCLMIFGLPMIFLEFFMGQSTNSGPATIFRNFAPAFQGFGWATMIAQYGLCVYYIVIVSWSISYLFGVHEIDKWATCDNPWNSINCIREAESANCSAGQAFFNGSCRSDVEYGMAAPEEYFINRILEKSDGATDWQGIVPFIAISYTITWLVCWAGLCKGIKLLGWISYVTTPIRYIIVIVLFVNGIQLPGATTGVYFLLFKPRWEFVYRLRTWTTAITQICFSLSIGYGGLITMASYNDRKHNCFKDAIILSMGDTFTTIFCGLAVFSTLGFLAHQLKKPIDEVVQSGTTLAFVVYPQALARMNFGAMWSSVFFLMLIMLGTTTQIAMLEGICTSIYDQWPRTRGRKGTVSFGVCFSMFLVGFPMVFRNGVFIFTLLNEFNGTTGTCLAAAMEAIVVVYFYGRLNVLTDLREVFGRGKNWLSRAIGPASPYWGFNWMTISPFLSLLVLTMTISHGHLTYGRGPYLYEYPFSLEFIGWLVAFAPLLPILPYFFINYRKFQKEGRSWRELFHVGRHHPSYERIRKVHHYPSSVYPTDAEGAPDKRVSFSHHHQLQSPPSYSACTAIDDQGRSDQIEDSQPADNRQSTHF